MKNITESIRKLYPVSDKSIEELFSGMKQVFYPKHHILIEGGKKSGNVFFIENGFSRSYCLINGEEVTTWFSREGDITFALNDLYHNTAGFEFVELLEDSELFVISTEKLNRLCETNIEIANWSRVCHQECLLKLQLTRIDRLTLSAQERYEKLVLEQPDILQRANLGHLASYLGMTQPSLSKIRARKQTGKINP